MESDIVGWIEQLAELIDEKERSNFVIFGSAAIALNGVSLGRLVKDLDVFVAATTFEGLATRFEKKTKQGGDGPVPFYDPAPKIEILKSFPGVSFAEVAKAAAPASGSGGFPVGNLLDLLKWKRAQERDTPEKRAQDASDIARIEAYLSAR